ncbi:MAG TPA: hypothetical protein VKQ36_01155, partial [Ktedonobacterales bacterium]|nr:hypothetical protein [Ktedonobacterales bacterium]
GGVGYVVIVMQRARRQTAYQPVLEDWLWHTIFPFISYVVLVGAAILLPGNPEVALFGVAASTVLLLFIGIHNAWDNLTYLAITYPQPEDQQQDS